MLELTLDSSELTLDSSPASFGLGMLLVTEQNKAFNLVHISLLGADIVEPYPYPAIAATELAHGSNAFVQDPETHCVTPLWPFHHRKLRDQNWPS